MKKIFPITLIALLLGTGSCKKDSEFLDVKPTSILTNEQAFSDPAQVISLLANLYGRQVDFIRLDDWTTFADFGESFPSENGQAGIVQKNDWNYGSWGLWDYGYVRELNLFIERATAATGLTDPNKKLFVAEGRFLRANFYFEMAKRMGGVPLIAHSVTFEVGGDVTALQTPRAKESEVYDFVISEAEAIKVDLPADANEKSRASKGAALAMEARAALYAGSIAKYGASTPAVSTPGGEVGIPASLANAYYTKALAAAKELIGGTAGAYSLYNKKPDLAENFASLFLDKSNPETIFVEDYKVKGRTHSFTTRNQPVYGAEEAEGGRINPSLNLVESFEKLDNTYAPIQTDVAGAPILYTNQTDPFAGRDARLAGTVILPGSSFKGRKVDIWAGVQLANSSIVSGFERGANGDIGTAPNEKNVQVVGLDGPVNQKEFTAQSGFYIRKYLDPTAGAGSRGTGSDVAQIHYRYGEVLLNAAEAAFELGQTADAASYMNMVRARAGLIIPLTPAQITFDRIVHERRVELAFEGHILYDMKRWRLAHVVWDGNKMTVTDLLSNIGSATKRNTQPYGLWSYKYYNPASADNGKWIFKVVLPSLVTGANRFQLGNYYSNINDDLLSRNPKLVKQPNQ